MYIPCLSDIGLRTPIAQYQKDKKPEVQSCSPQPPNICPLKDFFEKHEPMDLFLGFCGLNRTGKSD